MSRSVKIALAEAWRDARRVLWGGLIAFGLYAGLIAFGPGIDGRFFPVLENYRLEDVRALKGGGFSFRPTFTKSRDCTYYGVTWFAQDPKGNLTRIQLARSMEPGPPETGPVGDRIGNRVTLFPPPDTTAVFGLNHHDCGVVWQTRTTVGPFVLRQGIPDTDATPPRLAFRQNE